MELAFGVLIGLGLAALGGLLVRRWVGFAAQRSADYAQRKTMDVRQALHGRLAVDGVLYGPLGRVVSRFTAEMNCAWQGNDLVIDELFQFDSGLEQTRRWTLNLGEDGRLRGGAGDIFGAVGEVAGDALVLRYRLQLPPKTGGHVLSVTDWMYALDNGTLVNRSQMRKFGIKMAELVATIRPVTEQAPVLARRAG